MWKECELIVKNDSEEFGLFNNRDESTIERKFIEVRLLILETYVCQECR